MIVLQYHTVPKKSKVSGRQSMSAQPDPVTNPSRLWTNKEATSKRKAFARSEPSESGWSIDESDNTEAEIELFQDLNMPLPSWLRRKLSFAKVNGVEAQAPCAPHLPSRDHLDGAKAARAMSPHSTSEETGGLRSNKGVQSATGEEQRPATILPSDNSGQAERPPLLLPTARTALPGSQVIDDLAKQPRRETTAKASPLDDFFEWLDNNVDVL